MGRHTFNQAAISLGYPLYWRSDDDGVLQKEELTAWWHPDDLGKASWFVGDAPTPSTLAAIGHIQQSVQTRFRLAGLSEAEQIRRTAVRAELAEGRLTLLETDLRQAPDAERQWMEHMLEAARGIEVLHRLQMGTHNIDGRIPTNDGASRMALHRNHEARCVAPVAARDAQCRLLPDGPPPPVGIYPPRLQREAGWCERLQEEFPDVMGPFDVVVGAADGGFAARSYRDAWPSQMEAVAGALDQAASVLDGDEAALKTYLGAAAKAFRTNDWFAADAAWAAMNARNSAWYVRIGPDETYWEPCNRKAGFQLSLARIDRGSLQWQDRFDPVKADMELALAEHAGEPYTAREVAFDLPDFIEVVLNAGDARSPLGATIGQSLPNWGPTAQAGGRTVAMTNLFTDPDSVRAHDGQVRSLICGEDIARFGDPREPLLLSTVLHEAAHNLGPSHDYTVDGQTDEDAFGGPLASTMEELKAQTAALFFSDWLAARERIEPSLAARAHAADIAWSFGKIADGMYTTDGYPKAYAQLSAIQLGWFVEQGAMVWKSSALASNGQDRGCFDVDFDALTSSIEALTTEVLQIKSSADRERAEALKARFVDAEDGWADLRDIITERWLRVEGATFVYGFRW